MYGEPGPGVEDGGWHSGTLPVESEVRGAGAHGIDHELDVRIEVDAKLLRPEQHVIAIHAASERLVLHLLSDGPGVDLVQALRRPHECRRGDESRKLVDGEQRLGHCRLTGHGAIGCVAEYRLKDVVRPTAFTEYFHAVRGMLLHRRVRGVWITLIIEIMNQAGESPSFGIFAELLGVRAHGGLDGQHVLP